MPRTSKTPQPSTRARQAQTEPENVVLYLRISNDPEGVKAGITRQRDDGRALCKRKSWRIVQEFVDNDRSASRYARKVRPEFAEMLDLIDAGAVTRIVAYN